MISNENINEKPLGIEIIAIFLKRWKIITLLVAVAAVCSIVITAPVFIDPVYKAETVIYPPATNTSTNLLNSDMRFGTELEINNEVQILHSTILRDSIVKKYKLFAHYKIDTTSPKKNYELNKLYDENIKTDQSRYNSIEVNVYDKDPVVAAAIANDLVNMGDKVKSGIIKKNLSGAFEFVRKELNLKIKEITQLGDSIIYLQHKNYRDAVSLKNQHYLTQKGAVDDLRTSIGKIRSDEGVYDMDNQFKTIYESYMSANSTYLIDSGMVAVMKKHFNENDTALVKKQAELEGTRIASARLRQKLDQLNHSGKKYNALFDNYNFEKGILGELKAQYEIENSSYEKEFPSLRLETLKNKYAAEQLLYNNLKAKYELAFSNLSDQVPTSYVISPAEVPVRKNSPNRLIICLIASFSVLIISVVYFLIADYFQKNPAVLQG